MRTLLLILLLSVPCMASGPKYSFSDSKLNDEMDNIYHDIDSVLKGEVRISSLTVSSVTVTGFAGGSAFKVLQIKMCTTTSLTSTTNSTFQASNLTCSITTADATTSILVMACGPMFINTAGVTGHFALFRGASNLMAANGGQEIFGGNIGGPGCLIYDDPLNTSTTQAYNVYLRSGNGVAAATFGDGNVTQVMVLVEHR